MRPPPDPGPVCSSSLAFDFGCAAFWPLLFTLAKLGSHNHFLNDGRSHRGPSMKHDHRHR